MNSKPYFIFGKVYTNFVFKNINYLFTLNLKNIIECNLMFEMNVYTQINHFPLNSKVYLEDQMKLIQLSTKR